MKKKILLVESDQNERSILKHYLETFNYSIDECSDGMHAQIAFAKNKYDLCLCDILLPKIKKFALLEYIRTIDQEVAIIILTNCIEKNDRIKAFRLGCDDYISKPFDTEELLLRIEALLKRTQKKELPRNHDIKYCNDIFIFGNYTFNVANRQLIHPTLTRKMTKKEVALLHILCKHPNILLPREYILRQIWGCEDYATIRSMDVFISKLRTYLALDVDKKYINNHSKSRKKYIDNYEPTIEIKNIHGIGFILYANVSKKL